MPTFSDYDYYDQLRVIPLAHDPLLFADLKCSFAIANRSGILITYGYNASTTYKPI